jgi:hypothetical protein
MLLRRRRVREHLLGLGIEFFLSEVLGVILDCT